MAFDEIWLKFDYFRVTVLLEPFPSSNLIMPVPTRVLVGADVVIKVALMS